MTETKFRYATSTPSWWGLGRLCPIVLALWAMLDISLRFVPEEWFRVNPITIALRQPGHHSSFEPNFSLQATHYVGDAAREANLPGTEHREALRFSTDPFGYRLNPYLDDNGLDVVFLRGFSFVYGGALSDEETLPAALTRIGGLRAYNGGRWHLDDTDDLNDIDWLLARLPHTPRTAVLVYLEHENPGARQRRRPWLSRATSAMPSVLAQSVDHARAVFRRARRYARAVSRWWEFSPLDIMATRLHLAIANDRILPNGHRERGRQLTLPDGRPIIFREYEVAPAREQRGSVEAQRTATYLEWWRDRLAERKLETLVLILPTRYTVYAPSLETGPLKEQASKAVEYLDRVSNELTRRGIPNINGARIFLATAAEELAQGELSFYREDNHWNARGVDRIARVLAETLRSRAETAPSILNVDDEAGDSLTLTPSGSPSQARPPGLGRAASAPASKSG